MVKHTQTICRQFAGELFVFDHFVGLALKGLVFHRVKKMKQTADKKTLFRWMVDLIDSFQAFLFAKG